MRYILKITGLLTLIAFLAMNCKPSNKINEVVGITKITLENTRWNLVELNSQAVTIENKPYLVFASKSMVLNGFGGCNQLAGSYELNGQKIKFNNIAATRMFCAETMTIETSFLQSLEIINVYRLEGHELILLQDEGVIARLRVAN